MQQSINGITKAPSAAHLCRLIRPTPEQTAHEILQFYKSKPSIVIYPALEYLTKLFDNGNYDFLVKASYECSNKKMAETAREILPLGRQYLYEHPINWFRPIKPVIIQLSPKIAVPIKPLGIAGTDLGIKLIAGQAWKKISLNPFSFKLWSTIVKIGILDNDPDITDFHWLEMSSPQNGCPRELIIRSSETAGFFNDEEMAQIIHNIETAMDIVHEEKKKLPLIKKDKPKDPNQKDLF